MRILIALLLVFISVATFAVNQLAVDEKRVDSLSPPSDLEIYLGK